MAAEHDVGNRRAAWRFLASEKQNEQPATYATEYVVKVEAATVEVRNGILAVMDENLVPSDSAGESSVLCFNVKGDKYRYLAELATSDAESKAAKDARVACAEDTKIAEKDLVVTLILSIRAWHWISVSQYEVHQIPDEACRMARVAFKDVIVESDNVAKDPCKDSTLIMQPQGAGNPLVRVKALITDLITRLQAESLSEIKALITNFITRLQADSSSEIRHQSYYDEEMAKSAMKNEDLETQVATHSFELEAEEGVMTDASSC